MVGETVKKSQAFLTVAFEGPGVKDGTMEVRELAPSLLAFGRLVERANNLTNREGYHVSTRIRATHAGSFNIDVQITQSLISKLTDLLTSTDVANAATITASILALLKLIKHLRGKKPKDVTTLETDESKVSVTNDLGDEMVFNNSEVNFYGDREMVVNANDLVSPLGDDEIDAMEMKMREEKQERVERIEKEDKEYFSGATEHLDEDVEHEGTTVQKFELESANFREGLVWRLAQGDDRYSAYLLDGDFQKQIDRGEVSFRKGDIMTVRLHSIVKRKPDGGLTKRNEILEVINHRHADVQAELPDD